MLMLNDLVRKGLDPMDIMNFDRDHLWERFFLAICGLDYENAYSYLEEVITCEVLENHLEEILDYINKFKEFVENPILRPKPPNYGSWVTYMDDIYIGYQILGLLILYTKAQLPFEVYDAIIYSTTWEYDKTRMWTEGYVEQRKKNLEIFRELIITHKSNEK